jgi:hypothetical protein
LNATWIAAARRLSPRVITDLYATASHELASFAESLPDDAPALFAVSWAGEAASEGWFDLGREFTEIWHHAAQIRDAVGAGAFPDPSWLRAVLEISVRALPHAYEKTQASDGSSLLLEVSGPSGGVWELRRSANRWMLFESKAASASAVIRMADDTAWRLFFNALSPRQIAERVRVTGDEALALPLLGTRSVIV